MWELLFFKCLLFIYASFSFSLFYSSRSENENKNGETPSYDFLQLNSDHRTMKNNESMVSPLLKTNNIHDKGIRI